MIHRSWIASWIGIFLFLELAQAQEVGIIQGLVTQSDGAAVHHATVMIVEIGSTTETDHEGRYQFAGVPVGAYEVFAHATSLTSELRKVQVRAGQTAFANLVLQLAPVRQSVTVTATGRHETTFEAVQSVSSLDTFELSERASPSVGEVLEGESGIAKRSFGPGSSRPVIRGFDGDRVLVMKDGMRVGSLGSQSGDHAEPIDPGSLERIEVVKGPATLLYGSNAIGGVVNAISRHHELHQHRHQGVRGQLTGSMGSNNGLAGASATAEYGFQNWVFWGSGGGQRTGDYATPVGEIEDSKARIANAAAGIGWFGENKNLSIGYSLTQGRHGIPFASQLHTHEGPDALGEPAVESVDIDWSQPSVRITGGLQNLRGFVSSMRVGANLSFWEHNELEILEGGLEEVGTAFKNDQYVLRADFDQAKKGSLSGTFGFWVIQRDYDVTGEEALSPPTGQNGIAVFVLEELNLDRARLQFGARVEHMRYQPREVLDRGEFHGEPEESDDDDAGFALLPERKFTGASGGIGMRVPLWENSALVAHYTNSYRAPALEELYNFGPHVGNLAFEIGNPDLTGERSNGLDLSLRHSSKRLSAEANFFLYAINDFIYTAPTGEFEHGLFELEYQQGDSRFLGTELRMDVGLSDAFWLKLGLDSVDAQLTGFALSLPRIPPLRGRLGFDLRYRGLSFRPELKLGSSRTDIFPTETPTAGYAVFGLKASYTLPRQHFIHHLSVDVFNVGDRLYRNHVSLIKDLAPEIGRGVKLSYALRFF